MTLQRLRLTIRGVVQGVGFRPFIFALANQQNLSGLVGNESGGVFVEIEGGIENLQNFLRRVRENAPPLAHITEILTEEIGVRNDQTFGLSKANAAQMKTLWFRPMSASAKIVGGNRLIRETGDSASRLSTARTAERVSLLSKIFLTTAGTRR